MPQSSETDDIDYSGVRVRRPNLDRLSLCAAKLTVCGEIPSGDGVRWSHDKVISRALDALERDLDAKLPESVAAGQPSAMAQA